MVLAGSKANRLSSVSHTTKTIHQHHILHIIYITMEMDAVRLTQDLPNIFAQIIPQGRKLTAK